MPRRAGLWLPMLLMVAGVGGSRPALAGVKVGEAFPDLAAYDLEGSLPERAGQVVMIDFWATWCAPCKAALPAYAGLHREFSEQGLVIIAVSVDTKAAAYQAFVRKLAPPFATVRDGAQKLVAAVQAPAMPTTYLVDRRGVLRFVHVGYHGERTLRDLRAQIRELLEEDSS